MEQLSQQLTNRSADAIEIVRSGIHAYHSGLDASMLSKMMLSRLEQNTQGLICPICQAPLDA